MPTSAVITSMDSANMMVWLTPSMISGSASGSCTFHRIWRGVQPEVRAASMSAGGILRMPWSV